MSVMSVKWYHRCFSWPDLTGILVCEKSSIFNIRICIRTSYPKTGHSEWEKRIPNCQPICNDDESKFKSCSRAEATVYLADDAHSAHRQGSQTDSFPDRSWTSARSDRLLWSRIRDWAARRSSSDSSQENRLLFIGTSLSHLENQPSVLDGVPVPGFLAHVADSQSFMVIVGLEIVFAVSSFCTLFPLLELV